MGGWGVRVQNIFFNLTFYPLLQACSMYCRVGDTGDWISPRGAEFPDGTWCHNDGAQDFYCR